MNTTEIRMIIISWIITWQQTGQPRRNGISRNVQPSKTEPGKNKNLKRSITCNKIQSVFHKLPINKRPRPVGFWGEFYHTFKEGLIPILFKVFQKIWEDRLPNIPWSQYYLDTKIRQTLFLKIKKNTYHYSWQKKDAIILKKKNSKPNSTTD